jgi:hypothetical protein
MTEAAYSLEGLLREALAPVEPPADLVERLETTLLSITEMAVDELEGWELSAMRDPRNWVRPAVAVVAGGSAGAALVVLRARRRAQPRPLLPGSLRVPGGITRTAERAIRDLEREARRILRER